MNETTSEAPLTATVGERLRGDPHLDEAQKAVAGKGGRPGGEATGRRGFPWGTLAVAVVGWAFATAISRRVRSRARRLLEGATAIGEGARKAAARRFARR
jgi:hypothetical protein